MNSGTENWPELCVASASASKYARAQVRAALKDPVRWIRDVGARVATDAVEDLTTLAAQGARPGIAKVLVGSSPETPQLDVALINSSASLRCSIELDDANNWRIDSFEVCGA